MASSLAKGKFLSSSSEAAVGFTCYERLSAVTRAVAVRNYPNTTAVAREIAGGNAVLCNQLMAQAKACIQQGFQFYHQKFSVQFHGTVRAFKAARLCCRYCLALRFAFCNLGQASLVLLGFDMFFD